MVDCGDPVPGEDFVSRWCRPKYVDEGWPKVSAFYPRPKEEYLSGNWLEYYTGDRETAVNKIIDAMPLDLSDKDRFIVLQVDEILDSIHTGGGHSPSVIFKPENDNPSHVAIGWDNWPQNNQTIASELFAKVTSKDIYPGGKD